MSTNFHLTARLLPSDTAAGKVLEAQHMSGTSQCLQVLGRVVSMAIAFRHHVHSGFVCVESASFGIPGDRHCRVQ